MAAPIAGVSPMYALCFLGYSHGLSLQRIGETGARTQSVFEHFNAGLLSGVYTTAVMVPGERIKVMLQLSGTGTGTKYNGPIDCAKGVIAAEGIQGLFRGTAATLLRDVPGSGVYFGAYVGFKRLFTEPGKEGELSPGNKFIVHHFFLLIYIFFTSLRPCLPCWRPCWHLELACFFAG